MGGDLIDARGVHQLHRRQPRHLHGPALALLRAGAAVGHVRGEMRLAEQGIEQAGFAHPHPAEYRHPQPPLRQGLQLLIEGAQLRRQG